MGWQSTVVQPWQMTTVWAWEKTVVMVKQPGHLTSMKNERGAGTRIYMNSLVSTCKWSRGLIAAVMDGSIIAIQDSDKICCIVP